MNYTLEIEATSNLSDLNIEDIGNIKASLGEIEDIITKYDVEIDSIDIGRISDRETFIIRFEDFRMMASLEMIRLKKSGSKENLTNYGNLIEDIARLYREKQQDIQFTGSLDISGEKSINPDKVFEKLTSPLDEWEKGIAVSFTYSSKEGENPDTRISLFKSGDSTRLLVSSNIANLEENPEKENQRFLSDMINEQIDVWENSFKKLEGAIDD